MYHLTWKPSGSIKVIVVVKLFTVTWPLFGIFLYFCLVGFFFLKLDIFYCPLSNSLMLSSVSNILSNLTSKI